MTITYHKGSLGYGVAKDGHPIGVIKYVSRCRHMIGGRMSLGKGWLVSIDGFRPGVDPATRGKHYVLTLREAKALVKLHAGRASHWRLSQKMS